VSQDSRNKNRDVKKHSESLDGIKNYFRIESQEDNHEFQKYIKRHTKVNLDD
jgi:hypothetical protein